MPGCCLLYYTALRSIQSLAPPPGPSNTSYALSHSCVTFPQVLGDAQSDTRCRGLLATLGGRENFQGLAQLQELRNALLDFKAHGQGRGAATYAYSNTFGEGGMNGTAVYYLASVFDKVYVPPTGLVSLLGFESSQVGFRGMVEVAVGLGVWGGVAWPGGWAGWSFVGGGGGARCKPLWVRARFLHVSLLGFKSSQVGFKQGQGRALWSRV